MDAIKNSAPLRVLPAALLLLLGPGPIAAQEAPKLFQEFEQSFRTEAKSVPGFEHEGPNAARCVHFEAEGLRIKLPEGYAGSRPNTGLKTTFGARGDFEVTMGYEMLNEPGPDIVAEAGTRISLGVVMMTPKTYGASLSRAVSMKGHTTFVAWSQRREEGADKMVPRSRVFPASDKTGRLRIVRAGTVLSYLAAPGKEEDFKLLFQLPLEDGDVKHFRIATSTGGAKVSLEVRITDFHLRAESIPGMPAAANGDVAGGDPASSQAGGGRIWWALGILALVLGLVLGGLFVARRKRGKSGDAIGPASKAETAAVSFACPECGKVLKVRGALAGKKVRCPGCDGSVAAPASPTAS